jgi:hypothetical protein
MSEGPPAGDYLERLRAVKAAKERSDLPYLVRALVDPDHGGRAARALGELGATESVPALIRLLDSPDFGTRVDGARALAMLGAAEATPRLRELATTDQKPMARSWFCVALADLGDPATVELTLPLLQDPAFTVRASAAQTLGELGDPAALEAVRSARPRFRRAPLDWWVFHETFRRSIARLERKAAGKRPRNPTAEKGLRGLRELPWIVVVGAIVAAFWIYAGFWWAVALAISIATIWLLMVYLWLRGVPLE